MQFLDKAGLTTLVNWANSKFATKFRVVSTDNKSIGTDKDSAGVTFTGGTNKFTVSDGTNSFDVAITPSISNNITGSGTSGQAAVFNGANSLTGRAIATSVATNNSTSLVTEGAVKSYVDDAIDGLTAPNDAALNVKVGSTTTEIFSADTATNSTVEFAGSGATTVTLKTTDVFNPTITISSTDAHVTAVGNHYTPTGGSAASATAGTAVGWGGSAVTGVTVDAAGHVTGVTTGAIPVNPVSTNTVTSSAALTANQVVVGNGNKTVKASGYTLGGATLGDTTGADKRLATEAAVADAVSGLSGAMHYIGTSTSEITDGGTQNPTISGYSGTAKTAGNVVIYGSKEFVWDGSAWEEFGDEGSYALKTVSVTGTGALSGGGTLTESRTITHNTSGATAGTYGPGNDVTGTNNTTISVPEITVDQYGHVTAISNKTYTSKDTTYTALKNPNSLTIGTGDAYDSMTIGSGMTYDGSVAKSIVFSDNPATNTNVKFDIVKNGNDYFVTGTVTESVNTDRYVNSAAFASQGTNGANGTKMTLTRAGSDTQTVTATIPVATTSAAGVMSGEMVTKLNGIAAGAEVNVQSDWNATSGDAMILNKPDIVMTNAGGYDYLSIGSNTNTISTSIKGRGNVNISDGNNSIKLDRGGDNGIDITANDGADGTIRLTASSNISLNTSGTNKAYYNNKEIATKDDIPAAVTESTVSGWGFTKNTGTVTSVTPGTGLTGTSSDAAITTSGTINLKTASTSEIGGIIVGAVGSSTVTPTNTTSGVTSRAVVVDSAGKAYVNVPNYATSSGVTSITPGAGLVNGSGTKAAVTSTGTVKAALVSETALTSAAVTTVSDTSSVHAVMLDSNGKLAVKMDEAIPESELLAILYPNS